MADAARGLAQAPIQALVRRQTPELARVVGLAASQAPELARLLAPEPAQAWVPASAQEPALAVQPASVQVQVTEPVPDALAPLAASRP
ncbi:MAG: hypothetical protein H7242_04300 [Microbacteriaceae bacterium]|nr:hypothetical protein [Burkholderiaceae bacterium]